MENFEGKNRDAGIHFRINSEFKNYLKWLANQQETTLTDIFMEQMSPLLSKIQKDGIFYEQFLHQGTCPKCNKISTPWQMENHTCQDEFESNTNSCINHEFVEFSIYEDFIDIENENAPGYRVYIVKIDIESTCEKCYAELKIYGKARIDETILSCGESDSEVFDISTDFHAFSVTEGQEIMVMDNFMMVNHDFGNYDINVIFLTCGDCSTQIRVYIDGHELYEADEDD
ncbi:MAG: hypothetical protein INQ03_08195 [Candidatus Heimdallarchaeota archaeon]|nr:hypothetical protein [Candidatus Heimdallarchaeota archaeon]